MVPYYANGKIWEVIIWEITSFLAHIFFDMSFKIQYRMEDREEMKKHEKTRNRTRNEK
jgi:lipid-A-disaccharide synthase-like uncharacterized protein